MLKKINLENILFLDIETVAQHEHFSELSDSWKSLWEAKARNLKKENEDDTAEAIYNRAAIYAEFGKIVCISCGYFHTENGKQTFRIKSYYGDDEAKLLREFCDLLNKHFNKPVHSLCAHNGKEFDFPYVSRRCIINGVSIPEILDVQGKKPWEINNLDTMELWKFGDFKNFTSLNLLAAALGIPTPKDDIDGSQVYHVYYKEKNLPRIVTYCQKDVITIAQVVLKYRFENLLKADDVVYLC